MKKLFTLIFLLCASVAHADLSFTESGESGESNGDPRTLSFSCTSTADLLVVGISVQVAPSPRTGGTPTYNGSGMTQAGTTNTLGGEGDVEVWYLVDPGCTGSALTLSVPNTANNLILLSAATFSAGGTDTAGYVGSVNDGTATNVAPATVTCTPNQSGDAMYSILHWGNNATTDWGTYAGSEIFKFDLGQEMTGAYYHISTDANPFEFSVDDDGSSGPDTDDYSMTCAVWEQVVPSAGRRRMIMMSEVKP